MNMRKLPGRSVRGDGTLRKDVLAALPFELTDSQTQALAEIEADMASPSRMLRLVQGDVGSGKTVVALLAMMAAVESGGQAALMAADRDSGPAASGEPATPGRGGWRVDRAAHGPRKGQGAGPPSSIPWPAASCR